MLGSAYRLSKYISFQWFVRSSPIEGISHRYHRCGPIFMSKDKGYYRGSSLRMAFRIFRCHRAFKTNEGSLDTSFGDLKPI
jgi:hypothetical protein